MLLPACAITATRFTLGPLPSAAAAAPRAAATATISVPMPTSRPAATSVG